MLVEVVRLLPEQDGTIGGLQIAYLAKALRRVLGPAIDLLWEQGEHPYQTFLSGNNGVETRPSLKEQALKRLSQEPYAPGERVSALYF
jgi:hypothetical protein